LEQELLGKGLLVVPVLLPLVKVAGAVAGRAVLGFRGLTVLPLTVKVVMVVPGYLA
jgi:hypothetical protein